MNRPPLRLIPVIPVLILVLWCRLTRYKSIPASRASCCIETWACADQLAGTAQPLWDRRIAMIARSVAVMMFSAKCSGRPSTS